MVIPEEAIEFVSIVYAIFALLGVYLVARTFFRAGKRMDSTILRARAFISESFLKDTWMVLFLACFFFLIHASMEMNEMFGFMDESVSEFIKETIELGIILCIDIAAYKWFKLMGPVEHLEHHEEHNIFSAETKGGEVVE